MWCNTSPAAVPDDDRPVQRLGRTDGDDLPCPLPHVVDLPAAAVAVPGQVQGHHPVRRQERGDVVPPAGVHGGAAHDRAPVATVAPFRVTVALPTVAPAVTARPCTVSAKTPSVGL